jgi:YcaO-like protein with predicted kinase domain
MENLPNSISSFLYNQSHLTFENAERRAVSASITLKKIERLLPVLGITRVANITGLDKIGLPVVMVVRPNSKSLSVSQGKGFTLEEAKVSGLMESIENYHAERIALDAKFLSYEDICFKYKTVDPTVFPRTLHKKYTASTVIPWIQAKNIITEEEIWLPLELVQTDYTVATIQSLGYFLTDTNGLASGNTKLEATNHALCELIERDALAIWQIEKRLQLQENRLVSLHSIDNPYCKALIAKYQEAGILVRVHDITTDLGIPSFACEIIADSTSEALKVRPAMGSGCHPCKDIALSKALIEAAQSRLTFISGSRDDQTWDHYAKALSKNAYQTLAENFQTHEPKISFQGIKSFNSKDAIEDQSILLGSLTSNNVSEVFLVDLTKEEFRIPVVKVIAPALEGITNFEQRQPGKRSSRVLGKINE